jgi:Na+-translocating ferredoxin:NAD+ oxidoreductase RNF subunit RnfB
LHREAFAPVRTFGDIKGKLVLRIECTKCDRKGCYSLAKRIDKHGRKVDLRQIGADQVAAILNAGIMPRAVGV